MEVIQILAILFGLFAFSIAFLRFKDGRSSTREFLFWGLLWALVIIVAFLPGVAGTVSTLLGIARPVDAVIYLSIILLFYLSFRTYVKIDSLEQEITKVVKEEALRKRK